MTRAERRDQHTDLRERCARHPLVATLALTLVWHLVLIVLASVIPLPGSDAWQDMRAAGINLLTLLVPLVALRWLRGWRTSGLTSRPRQARWLVVLIVVAVVPSATGLSAALTAVLTTVALQLCLAANEETLSRGLVQPLTASLGPWRCAAWVGGLFGAGHALNAVFFDASWFEAGGQVLSATAGGFCFAAVRFHVVSLWPFIGLHALENTLRDLSSGALSIPLELSLAAVMTMYGVVALAALRPGQEESIALTPGPRSPG